MKFSVTILGANSAIPSLDRFPTCQCLHIHDRLFIMDCGEGAQINLSKHHIKRHKIDAIFISHLHGDHIYGLPGLLSSFSLSGRERSLTIYGPKGIKEFIETIKVLTYQHSSFILNIKELDHQNKLSIYKSSVVEVFAFPMKHRVPTYGYIFVEGVRERNILKDKIEHFNLTIDEIKLLKLGSDIRRKDLLIRVDEVMSHPKPQRSYAYCSDTIFDPELVPYIQGASSLYHESTYLHELHEKAAERMHATSKEAAQIAKAAKVNQLILGHFSSRYKDLSPLKAEAKVTFENTILAIQGREIDL